MGARNLFTRAEMCCTTSFADSSLTSKVVLSVACAFAFGKNAFDISLSEVVARMTGLRSGRSFAESAARNSKGDVLSIACFDSREMMAGAIPLATRQAGEAQDQMPATRFTLLGARGGMSMVTGVKPLQGGEIEHDRPIGSGFREGIREALARLHPGQALPGKDRAGAITEQPLQPRRAK